MIDNQEDIITTIVDQYKDTLNEIKNYHENKLDSGVIRELLTTLSNLSRKEEEKEKEEKPDLNKDNDEKKEIILKDKWLLNIFKSFENNEAIETFHWYDEETQKELKNNEAWIIPKTDEIRRSIIKEQWFPFRDNDLALINSLLFDILWWRISFLKESKKMMPKS